MRLELGIYQRHMIPVQRNHDSQLQAGILRLFVQSSSIKSKISKKNVSKRHKSRFINHLNPEFLLPLSESVLLPFLLESFCLINSNPQLLSSPILP